MSSNWVGTCSGRLVSFGFRASTFPVFFSACSLQTRKAGCRNTAKACAGRRWTHVNLHVTRLGVARLAVGWGSWRLRNLQAAPMRVARCLSQSVARASPNPLTTAGSVAWPWLEISAYRFRCAACYLSHRKRCFQARQDGRVGVEPQVCALHWHGTSRLLRRRRHRRLLLLLLLTRLSCRAALRRP